MSRFLPEKNKHLEYMEDIKSNKHEKYSLYPTTVHVFRSHVGLRLDLSHGKTW